VGDEGYPGILTGASSTRTPANELAVDHHATTDTDHRQPDAAHTFNSAVSGADIQSSADDRVYSGSRRSTPSTIPTGELAPVAHALRPPDDVIGARTTRATSSSNWEGRPQSGLNRATVDPNGLEAVARLHDPTTAGRRRADDRTGRAAHVGNKPDR
jgi:hypothetical protein